MTGRAGQLYAKELYAYKCQLLTQCRTRFEPGHVVSISATYNALTGIFDAWKAVAVEGEQGLVVDERTTGGVVVSCLLWLAQNVPLDLNLLIS